MIHVLYMVFINTLSALLKLCVCVCIYIYIFVFVCVCIYIYTYIRGVTGGTDQTSGGCSLCYTIRIVSIQGLHDSRAIHGVHKHPFCFVEIVFLCVCIYIYLCLCVCAYIYIHIYGV